MSVATATTNTLPGRDVEGALNTTRSTTQAYELKCPMPRRQRVVTILARVQCAVVRIVEQDALYGVQ